MIFDFSDTKRHEQAAAMPWLDAADGPDDEWATKAG